MTCTELISYLDSGERHELMLPAFYWQRRDEGLAASQERIKEVVSGFRDRFGGDTDPQIALFSAPGRTEIGGNHTDHQHGHVLCASVDLDILACAAPNCSDVIRIHSAGYPDVTVALDGVMPCPDEVNTSAALVRGIAAKIKELGHPVSGFDACLTSDVLTGSGLSSSAAFEVLLGNIINHFFCNGELDAVEIAKIGQYAENRYFGKPCGLMDQIACSVGGIVSIDFADPTTPKVEKVNVDFSAFEHALCVIDTGSCHCDLTDDYADITREMGMVAAFFGEKVLRAVPQAEFRKAISVLRKKCGDRAVLRAIHFYADDLRAQQEANALVRGDFKEFLALVNQSGISSALYLQNTWSVSDPGQQAIPLALTEGKRLLGDRGAIRVHGGGFAGTVQAFVPRDLLEQFKTGMEILFGPGTCKELHIRPVGGCVLNG